jgi:hypothetical protein
LYLSAENNAIVERNSSSSDAVGVVVGRTSAFDGVYTGTTLNIDKSMYFLIDCSPNNLDAYSKSIGLYLDSSSTNSEITIGGTYFVRCTGNYGFSYGCYFYGSVGNVIVNGTFNISNSTTTGNGSVYGICFSSTEDNSTQIINGTFTIYSNTNSSGITFFGNGIIGSCSTLNISGTFSISSESGEVCLFDSGGDFIRPGRGSDFTLNFDNGCFSLCSLSSSGYSFLNALKCRSLTSNFTTMIVKIVVFSFLIKLLAQYQLVILISAEEAHSV